MARTQIDAIKNIDLTQELANKQDLQVAVKKFKEKFIKWQIGIGFVLITMMAKGFGWLVL